MRIFSTEELYNIALVNIISALICSGLFTNNTISSAEDIVLVETVIAEAEWVISE